MWPLPDDLTDIVLQERLYHDTDGIRQGHRRRTKPNCASVHRGLNRQHATLSVLPEEYHAEQPDGYRYGRWCDLCRSWCKCGKVKWASNRNRSQYDWQ